MRKWREASMIPARLIAGSATVQREPWRMQAERRQEKDFRRHAPGIRLDLLTFACKGFHVLCPVDVPWSHIASISVTYRLLWRAWYSTCFGALLLGTSYSNWKIAMHSLCTLDQSRARSSSL